MAKKIEEELEQKCAAEKSLFTANLDGNGDSYTDISATETNRDDNANLSKNNSEKKKNKLKNKSCGFPAVDTYSKVMKSTSILFNEPQNSDREYFILLKQEIFALMEIFFEINSSPSSSKSVTNTVHFSVHYPTISDTYTGFMQFLTQDFENLRSILMVNNISEVTTDKLEKYNKVQNNILDLIDEKLGNKYKQVILESGALGI